MYGKFENFGTSPQRMRPCPNYPRLGGYLNGLSERVKIGLSRSLTLSLTIGSVISPPHCDL